MPHNNELLFQWHELVLLCLSAGMCVLLIFLRQSFPRLSGRHSDLFAVQAFHVACTPRVGGVAIFVALAVSAILAPVHITVSYAQFILATLILFAVGLLEDLGFNILPRWRLLAAAVASLVAIACLEVWVPRVGIPILDPLMSYWAVGIPITLLVTAGIANGFNLIDGVNGLSSLAAISAAISLALIGKASDYITMMHLGMMVAASVTGFMLLNYPFGKIFLGDAGAYTLGFVLSWFGIAILLNSPEASPWAVLLTMYWPVADTLLAIYRRLRRGVGTMAPDRLHIHQMVLRGLEICIFGRGSRHITNPLTTLILAPCVITPPITGVLLWDQSSAAFVAFVMFSILLFASYVMMPRLIRCIYCRKLQDR